MRSDTKSINLGTKKDIEPDEYPYSSFDLYEDRAWKYSMYLILKEMLIKALQLPTEPNKHSWRYEGLFYALYSQPTLGCMKIFFYFCIYLNKYKINPTDIRLYDNDEISAKMYGSMYFHFAAETQNILDMLLLGWYAYARNNVDYMCRDSKSDDFSSTAENDWRIDELQGDGSGIEPNTNNPVEHRRNLDQFVSRYNGLRDMWIARGQDFTNQIYAILDRNVYNARHRPKTLYDNLPPLLTIHTLPIVAFDMAKSICRAFKSNSDDRYSQLCFSLWCEDLPIDPFEPNNRDDRMEAIANHCDVDVSSEDVDDGSDSEVEGILTPPSYSSNSSYSDSDSDDEEQAEWEERQREWEDRQEKLRAIEDEEEAIEKEKRAIEEEERAIRKEEKRRALEGIDPDERFQLPAAAVEQFLKNIDMVAENFEKWGYWDIKMRGPQWEAMMTKVATITMKWSKKDRKRARVELFHTNTPEELRKEAAKWYISL